MKITRFIATPTGGSQFEEIDIPITNERQDAEGHTLLLSNTYTSPGVCFVDLPDGLNQDWHQAQRARSSWSCPGRWKSPPRIIRSGSGAQAKRLSPRISPARAIKRARSGDRRGSCSRHCPRTSLWRTGRRVRAKRGGFPLSTVPNPPRSFDWTQDGPFDFAYATLKVNGKAAHTERSPRGAKSKYAQGRLRFLVHDHHPHLRKPVAPSP